jgi:hypothetical protein
MTVRDDIRDALHDAIGWQSGLAYSWAPGSPERAEALAAVQRYKAILRRRYGSDITALDEAISKGRPMGLDELRKLPSNNGPSTERKA